MKKYASIIVALVIAHAAFGAYVVDVTFNGNTNDIYSAEIKNDKGKKEFDAFLEIPIEFENGEISKSERIGLCEQIVVKQFKIEGKKISLSIQVTSTELHGFDIANVDNKNVKYPKLSTKSFKTYLTVHQDSWFTIGEVSNSNGPPTPTMIRVRRKTSNNKIESDE